MEGYPPEFDFYDIFEPFIPQRAGEPLVTTQRGWANEILPIGHGLTVSMVASANEVLRHCRVGKVTFKSEKNYSAKCG